MKGIPLDLAGQRFSKLLVIEEARTAAGHRAWRCRCDCGSQSVVRTDALRSGKTKGCGCGSRTHGQSKSSEHAIWRGIITRCTNQNRKHYGNYGGKGVSICAEWIISFDAFFNSVGPRPSRAHSIERIDVNGNYEPGNVKWALDGEQANNKRNTRFVEYRGTRMPLADAVRLAGSVIHREAAWARIRIGWAVEEALTTPRLFESPASKNPNAAPRTWSKNSERNRHFLKLWRSGKTKAAIAFECNVSQGAVKTGIAWALRVDADHSRVWVPARRATYAFREKVAA